MKNIFTYLLIITLLISCNKDKGNYDYKSINEVEITDIKESYTLLKGAKLVIEPNVKCSVTSDNLEYKWQLSPSTTSLGRVVSSEKNLNWDVDLEKGSYTLYYKVRDKVTNIEWKTHTVINISFPIARGYLLACEDKNGDFRLDMIATPEHSDTIVIRNIIGEDEMPKIKGARSAVYTGAASNTTNTKLWIIGEKEAYFYDILLFTRRAVNQFRNMVFTSRPIPDGFYVTDVIPIAPNGIASSYRFMRANNGWIFSSMLTSNGDFYANPINYINGENSNEPFNTSPYVSYSFKRLSGILAYDTDNDRFVGASNYVAVMSKFSDDPADPFPWNNKDVGRKLKYAENTLNTDGGSYNGNSFAIMYEKDNPSQQWIYKYYADASRPRKRGAYKIKNDIAGDFTNSQMFAFSSSMTVVFFTYNNKLYAYDYNVNNERLVEISFDKDPGDEITLIKFNTQISDEKDFLFVATYNEAKGEGTLRMLKLDVSSTDNIILEPNDKLVWSGLGKVKDINWRNS